MTDDNVNPDEAPPQTSSSLLARVKANDQGAWERFVHLYSPLVYRWCRQAGLQGADAADVGQEVFRAVTRSIAQFHHDQKGDSFRGWLRTVTWNKLRDFFRRVRKEGRPTGGDHDWLCDLPEESGPPSDEYAEDEELLVYRRAVEMVLDEFEDRTQRAFVRVVMEERPPADVARELGLTVNAVYLAKSRILRRLREEFADLLVE